METIHDLRRQIAVAARLRSAAMRQTDLTCPEGQALVYDAADALTGALTLVALGRDEEARSALRQARTLIARSFRARLVGSHR